MCKYKIRVDRSSQGERTHEAELRYERNGKKLRLTSNERRALKARENVVLTFPLSTAMHEREKQGKPLALAQNMMESNREGYFPFKELKRS